LEGSFGFGKSFLIAAADPVDILCVPEVRGAVIRVPFERLLVFRLSSGKVPLVFHFVAAYDRVGMTERRVEFQRLAGRRVGFWIGVRRIAAVRWQNRIGVSQTGVGKGIAGVIGDCSIEIGDRRL